MNKYKICVYAICKNEEKFVDRWMDAVKEADMVVVVDTGSTDNTIEKLRKRGALVYSEKIIPWRFDIARNLAMDYIPEDVDICVSNDLDEVFELGWREKLENAWLPHNTRAKYLFTYEFTKEGKPDKQFQMEKIHRRHDFRWVHPVHEVLKYSGTDPDNSVFVPDLILNHYPDNTKPRTQYLPLLELSENENPTDPQTVFWLGREYMYHAKYDEAIVYLQKYLALPNAQWGEERSAALRFIGRCYESKGYIYEAKRNYFRAIAECAYVRETYHDMAKFGYGQNDWPLVYYMVEKGLEIQTTTGSYLLESEAWGWSFYDLGAISCYRLGMYEKSHEYAVKACGISPSDIRLKNNLELINLKL